MKRKTLDDIFPPIPLANKALVARVKKGEFVKYVLEFYGPDGIYPMNATAQQVLEAIDVLIVRLGKDSIAYDTVDRERIRDIMIEKFGLVFPRV